MSFATSSTYNKQHQKDKAMQSLRNSDIKRNFLSINDEKITKYNERK